ncbi:MAG TPA: spermidine/putrescine ABC transporter substrate-binding protein [Candidatus Dormibacteraeota bacterium]|nr:spermidine/putrescine ABC transporter substrate-binding protein [Candidatus Dormibacteraeota bacterium]
MSKDIVPEHLDPAFIRGLTQKRITRRSALKGAGALSFASFLAACGIGGGGGGTTTSGSQHVNWVWDKATKAGQLDFANWPLYIDVSGDENNPTYPSLQKFTKDTGITVNYKEVIQDNAEWFAKVAPQLKAGQSIGWDIMVVTNGIQLSNYLFAHWLVELDPSKQTNFNKNASPRMLNRAFDPGNKFTMPWQSGLTGIGYNPKLTGREITSFNDLFDPAFKGRVGMFSNNQDVGNLALVGMGIKPETSKPSDWQKAADKLKQQRDAGIVRKYYDQSYIDALSKGDTWVSMAWSGDIYQANLSAGNQDLKFVVPQEGAVIWTDNMCIPVGAAHPVDAITYMDYVYQPAVAAMLTEYIDYITPVPGARDVILADAAAATDADTKQADTDTANSPLVFPSADDLKRTSYYRVLTTAEAQQWNDIFNSVIIT